MEVSKSIFKRQADFLEKNGKYLLQFTIPPINLYMNIVSQISKIYNFKFFKLNSCYYEVLKK